MNSSPHGKISEEKILELWVILEEQNKRKYTYEDVREIAQNLVDLHLHLARIHTDRLFKEDAAEDRGSNHVY